MQSVSYQPSAHLDSNTATGVVSREETKLQMRQRHLKKKKIREYQLQIQKRFLPYIYSGYSLQLP